MLQTQLKGQQTLELRHNQDGRPCCFSQSAGCVWFLLGGQPVSERWPQVDFDLFISEQQRFKRLNEPVSHRCLTGLRSAVGSSLF